MRFNRFGFQSNKHNVGTMTPTPSPTFSVTESTNATSLTYTIDTNVTSGANLFYTFNGNVTTNDIEQGTVGTFALNGSGNATLILDAGSNFTDTANIRQGAFELRQNSIAGTVVYTGSTKTYTPVNTVDIDVAGANANTSASSSYRYQNVSTDGNKRTIFWAPDKISLGGFNKYYMLSQIAINATAADQSRLLQFNNANVSTLDIEYIVVGCGGQGGTNDDGTLGYSEYAGAGGAAGGTVLVGTFTADTTQTYPITLGNSTTATSIFGLTSSVGNPGANMFAIDGVTGAGGNALGYAGSGGSGALNRGNITAGAAGTVVSGNAGQQGYLYEANTSIGGVGGDGYFVKNHGTSDRWIPEAAWDIWVGAGGSGGMAHINPSGGIDPPKPRNSNAGFNSSSDLVPEANVGPLGNFVNGTGNQGETQGFRTFGAGGYGVSNASGGGGGILPNNSQVPVQYPNGGGILLRYKSTILQIS